MRHRRTIVAAALAVALIPTAAGAGVKVTVVAPKHISDRDFRSAGERNAAINEIQRHLQQLGSRYLKAGQDLTVEVLDIDLAGDLRPFPRSMSDVRVMADVTPPRIKLRYTLRQNGRVTGRGTETLSDMNYLSRPQARLSGERLAYEKEMLRDWFEAKFVGTRSRS